MNGWRIAQDVGTYGTDYLQRAGIVLSAVWCANVVEDAVYPTASAKPTAPRSIAAIVIVWIDKDQIPPVRAFWSLTMYDRRQLFAVNPIDRYAIWATRSLLLNPDGSLDLYIQRDSPGKDKESNWLPAEDRSLTINLRLYWPKAEFSLSTAVGIHLPSSAIIVTSGVDSSRATVRHRQPTTPNIPKLT